MAPAGPGRGFTVTGRTIDVPKPHAALYPLTEKLPEMAEAVNIQMIWFVFTPERMVTPDGKVHSYKVVLVRGEIE
jgi:hypothetical protein